MNIHIGELTVRHLPSEEHLTISFSTASALTTERWKNKNISVDFLADYFANFFPGDPSVSTAGTSRSEAKNVISFVANELLENALKYNFDDTCPVSISLELYDDQILFILTNSVNPATVDPLQTYFQELVEGDPLEMFLAQLERNAADNSDTGSGVGFLTMRNDYGASLGWKLETTSNGATRPRMILTTLVQVALVREADR